MWPPLSPKLGDLKYGEKELGHEYRHTLEILWILFQTTIIE